MIRAFWDVYLSKSFNELQFFRLHISKYSFLSILLENQTSQNLTNRAIWCLSSLCQGMPIVRLKDAKKILPVLGQLLKTQTNPEALTDICWTISNMGSSNDRIREIIKSIDLRRLLELLENDKMTRPVLRVFGNIASGNDKQTEVIIQLGLMEHLLKLIEHTDESFRIEVCWILSNITAGTRNQIQVIILLNLLFTLLLQKNSF